MQPIKITVSSTRAVCSERPDPITTGMVGLRAEFIFSDDWDGLQKTAVCAGSGVAKDILVIQDAITVPPECLTDPASDLKIGLYGTNSTGNIVIPTVYAYCGRLFRGADPSGDTSTDYTLPIWAQLQAMIGDLSNLTTTARDNLVAAINEAAKSGGGGGGTAADVRMQVADGYIQYSTDGGITWRNLIAMKDLIGPSGKSAYTYAVEAGYTGTEAEFSARMAKDIPAVDSTLTQSGQAADAAVVGNRFSALSEEIAAIPSGADGKSAYAYAVEGGYTGAEAEFAAKLAEEMPDKLPNPNALTFTGAVTGTYDGSATVSVEIPSGGGGRTLELIADVTTAEETTMISITKDSDGNAFKVKSWAAYIYIPAHKRDTAKPFYARGGSYGGGMTFANMLVTLNMEIGFFLYPIANYDAQDALDMDHPLKVQYISSFGGNTADTSVGFRVNLSIFQVYTNNPEVLFPAGVRVRLWGVRT